MIWQDVSEDVHHFLVRCSRMSARTNGSRMDTASQGARRNADLSMAIPAETSAGDWLPRNGLALRRNLWRSEHGSTCGQAHPVFVIALAADDLFRLTGACSRPWC